MTRADDLSPVAETSRRFREVKARVLNIRASRVARGETSETAGHSASVFVNLVARRHAVTSPSSRFRIFALTARWISATDVSSNAAQRSKIKKHINQFPQIVTIVCCMIITENLHI